MLFRSMFFALDGTLSAMDHNALTAFFLGLLSNSFILGAIFLLSQSLCLCVLYHSLVNAISMSIISNNPMEICIVLTVLKIVAAIYVIRYFANKRQRYFRY